MPIPDLARQERYRVDAVNDVVGCLGAAASARCDAIVRAAGGAQTFLARVLLVDAERDELWLEAPRAPVIERALAPGATAAIDLTVDGVRSMLEARVLRIASHGQRPALVFALPAALYRVQRRERYRVLVPEHVPVTISLDAAVPSWRGLRVENLSTGGAGVIVVGSLADFELGRTFENAAITLADGQAFSLAMRVRHAGVTRLVRGASRLRVGLQFVRAIPDVDSAVARLVDALAKDADRPHTHV